MEKPLNPSTGGKMSGAVAADGNNIVECKESKEEEDSATEDLKSLCPREPDHEEVKEKEYSDTPEHGETGIKYESLRARKAWNMDCLHKGGHPEQRKVGTRREAKWLRRKTKKTLL